MTITRILVPVDFSPASFRGAAVAVDLARQLGARVRMVTVLDVGDLRVAMKSRLHGFTNDAGVRKAVRRWVEEQFARIEIPKGVHATRAVRRGIVEKEISAAIRSYRPQLVVMGSAGMTRRLPIGSKTDYVIRNSSVPVLVVTDRSEAP